MRKINLPNLRNIVRSAGYIDYRYRFTLNGKRMQIPLGTSRECTVTQIKERYAQAQNKAFNLKHGLDPIVLDVPSDEQQPILLRDIFDDWVAHEKNRSRTWLRDLFNIKPFVVFFGKESDWTKDKRIAKDCEIDLAALTSADINRFYADQYAQGNKTETVTKRHNYLNPLYTWLTNEKILKDNYYARKGKLKKPGSDKTPYQVLTRDQAELIVDNAPNEFTRTLWTIMIDTALSPVDARNLNKRKHLLNGIGDNGEIIPCIITNRAKTGKQSATPISDRIQALGDDIWGLGGSDKDQDNANVAFKKVCRKLGIKQNKGEKLSQYSFRHSLATHLISNGHSLDSVQRQLGHTLGSKVTQTYIANQIASEVSKTKSTLNERTI